MPRLAPLAACLLAALPALLAPASARADLQADAERLLAAWKGRGARVERLDPLFLERGRSRTLAVVPASAPAEESEPGCLTVALLGARTLELNAALDGGMPPPVPLPRALAAALTRPPDDEARLRSSGGALLLSRCGAERAELQRINVETSSPRGAVEVIVARSLIPLGEIREVLSERAAGTIAPRGDPGRPIVPGPLPERLARAERRARAEGAAGSVRGLMRASPIGAGQFDLELGEGCHRLELMADVPTLVPLRITDVDAEVHVQEGGRLLARDRADVPDARLDFCLGEPTVVEVPFVGAAGPVGVALLRSSWPLPMNLPLRWGTRARAGFATALRLRHVADPLGPPLLETIGVGGVTQVPMEVEPGRCYLASVALIRGESKAIRFSAHTGDRTAHDALERPEGASIAFCAETERSALFEVDLRGGSPWWVLAVWPQGAAPP